VSSRVARPAAVPQVTSPSVRIGFAQRWQSRLIHVIGVLVGDDDRGQAGQALNFEQGIVNLFETLRSWIVFGV
jgi:hypothetical protein